MADHFGLSAMVTVHDIFVKKNNFLTFVTLFANPNPYDIL